MIEDPPILTIDGSFARPSSEAIAALQGAATGVIADCMDGQGAFDHTIKPVGTPSPIFTATAITCNCGPSDNLAAFAALDLCRPGDALVIATDAFMHAAVIGDLYAGMAANAGVVAFVTDGTVRDVAGIDATGVPCFAAGITPNSPARNGPGTAGLPVQMGRQTVCSGDILVGDGDGVVVIPQARIAQVLDQLPGVLAAEKALEDMVKGGLVMPDWAKALLDDPRVRRLG